MTTCAHHWDIAVRRTARLALGVCLNCGDTKEFANHISLDKIYGKQSVRLPHSLTNRVNDQIEGDIRAADGAPHSTTRGRGNGDAS